MSTSESRQRPEQVKSRFTTEELAAIDERRGAYSRAAWLRNAALVALDRPADRPRRPGVPPEDVAAVAAISGDVRRATGAAIQLSKALRLAGHASFHAVAESVLADLCRQSDELAGIIEKLS